MPLADGTKISERMMEARLSPSRLGEMAGISSSTIKRARASKNVTVKTLERLANIFSNELRRKVSPDEITLTPHRASVTLAPVLLKKLARLILSHDALKEKISHNPYLDSGIIDDMMAGVPIDRSVLEIVAGVAGIDLGQFIQDNIPLGEIQYERKLQSHAIPTVPAQTNSAHFTIRDGKITTVPTQEIWPDENHYRRLVALQPPLLQATRTSHAELLKNNKPFGILSDITERYLNELMKEVHEINYAVLYAYGLQLSIAYESAVELIERGELPEFDLESLTSTRSVLQLHGPFILSSKDGRDLITDAERYERSPVEERRFQVDVEKFGEMLRERNDIVDEKTGEFIADITMLNYGPNHFERRYLFTKGAVKNLIIVFSAGALVASAAYIPIVGPIVAASLGLLTLEAMKKSKPFNDLSMPIRNSLDDLGDIDLERLRQIPREQLDKIRDFVVKNHEIMRRVGGSTREMRWFRDVVDWIANKNDDESP